MININRIFIIYFYDYHMLSLFFDKRKTGMEDLIDETDLIEIPIQHIGFRII